jgi:hypothetical protein
MKKKHELIPGAIMIIIVLAVLLFGLTRDNTNDVTMIYPTSGSSVVPQQYIQIHEYWTIEVREPDGSLGSRHEFENEVQGHYGRFWARVLAREAKTAIWTITLGSPNSGIQPFQDSTGNRVPGYITENIDTIGALYYFMENIDRNEDPNYFTNLTKEVPTSGSDIDKLVLNGRAIAALNGSLISVYTYLEIIAERVDPYEYTQGIISYPFSMSDLRDSIGEIDVLAGQQIIVKIVISFS